MNKKPILLGGIALGVIALTIIFIPGETNAGYNKLDRFEGRKTNLTNIMKNCEGMSGFREGRKGLFEGKEGINKERVMNKNMMFIDESNLSTEQKTQLDQIKKDQQEKMQELMKSFRASKDTKNVSELTKQTQELWRTHMAKIRVFVAKDKLKSFDAFLKEGKPQMMKMRQKGQRK